MRKATTLTLAMLLVLILGAGAIQLFFVAERDDVRELRVEDATATGAATSLTFVVRLSSAASSDVAFTFRTSDASAVAGRDYEAASGRGVIAEGDTVATFEVPVVGGGHDAEVVFTVQVTEVDGAFVRDGQAIGTIGP